MEEVDAVDNGISQWEEGEPRYALTTTLSARVARLNPTWNQPDQDTEVRRASGEETVWHVRTSGGNGSGYPLILAKSKVWASTIVLIPMIPRLGSNAQWIWFERSFCRD